MKLVSYNIQYSKGKDEQFNLDRIVSEIEGADLIALQEVETYFPRTGLVHQAQEIGARLPGYHWVYGPGIDIDASIVGDDGSITHRRRQVGNMVLSRWPILSSMNHLLPKMALTNQYHQQRAMIETVVDTDTGPLRFCSVHFDHIGPQTRLPQVHHAMDLLLNASHRGSAWGGKIAGDWYEIPPPPVPERTIVMGDFNFTLDSEEYALLIGDRSEKHGRLVQDGGFTDAWVAAGNDEDEGVSFIGSGERIDHCVVSSNMAASVRRAWIDMDAQGSDHQPFWVEIEG
ncbi:endonuclease/exonuclease/phosphatase family protein (plasmid) [Nitratireductor sp. GISD-1A_MAKvit]|uniref:endonuclease/exonuclease/phosphatase family protein n=1 Tax=Nitratireductor sp. GISD-1A_MAKvit TaxID=3234198 RepID=UPI00346548BC